MAGRRRSRPSAYCILFFCTCTAIFSLFVKSVELCLQLCGNVVDTRIFQLLLILGNDFLSSSGILTESNLLHVVGLDLVNVLDLSLDIVNLCNELSVRIFNLDAVIFIIKLVNRIPVGLCTNRLLCFRCTQAQSR